ncbi:hypothetical protein BA28_03823, partial [Mycobacterium tuberculosis NRITLD12]
LDARSLIHMVETLKPHRRCFAAYVEAFVRHASAGSRRARVTARAAVVARRAALTHL